MEPIHFASVAEVNTWVEAHSEDELQLAHSLGKFAKTRETEAYISAWLSVSLERRHAEFQSERERKESDAMALRLREVQAAEDSAAAARDSADSARASKWLAIVSSVVAVIATVVAIVK